MARAYGKHSTLRKERKQQTREKLLAAAAEVLAENGFAAGRVEDIAAHAGVSRQTFYFHFDSKEQLLLEIMRRLEDRLLVEYERLAAVAEPTPETSAEWAESFVALAREERATILLLMRTVPFELGEGGRTSEYYEEVIALMAGNLRAFALAKADRDPVRHARALLLFFQLEMMLRYALVEPGLDNRSLCLAWGAQWAAFVADADG